ncbi:MAG: hypothetical protein HY721_33975 [Planctomycetes bacterium]|nr:hypothetical protein [Planctomycetota bacterium]
MSKSRATRPDRRRFAVLAAWADERFSPDKRWEDLPLAAPVRGRPAKGRKPLGLKARTVKLPKAVWRELRAAAKRHGVTVNGVLIALGQELLRRNALDATIDRLIEERLLVPASSR